MKTTSLTLRSLPAVALVAALTLTGCGTSSEGTAANGSSSGGSASATGGAANSSLPASTTAAGHPKTSVVKFSPSQELKESGSVSPRVVLAYDGGLLTIDSKTGAVINDVKQPGFLRLNNAGDGRHVFVTDGDRFRLFDAGIVAEKHGDHKHYYAGTPAMTDVIFEAQKAGHVVVHEGVTTLFADGTGKIQSFDHTKLSSGDVTTLDAQTESAHHGVAVLLEDDSLLTTQGTTESRNTVQVVKDGKVTAETKDCPGVHGEAAAESNEQGDVIVVGCENGPVIFKDGAFHKVNTDFAYARTGNAAGSDHSDVVLMDLKTDENAEHERPTQVALVNTDNAKLTTVELGSSYWFRSLARGPEGEGVVLTYDGNLNIIDQKSGKVSGKISAISAWTEHEDWQDAGPILKVSGRTAFVTDAAKKELKIIDLETKKVDQTVKLPHAAVEMAVVTGAPESPKSDDHAGHNH